MLDSARSKVVIKDEAQRLVYGEVYAPLQIDTDEEAMTAEEIQKMAYSFMMRGLTDKIDVGHNYRESGCLVVESFIARKDDVDGFVEGSWVLGVKILPDELWEAVKKGELNGFSFAGRAQHQTVEAVVKVTRKLVGTTEKSDDGLLPPHQHPLDIEFDEDGKVTKGETDFVLGHRHPVVRTTATEIEMEHAHRMNLIDNEE